MNRSVSSRSHCVIIPSFNSGPLLIETVRAVLRYWRPVFVVIDGSDDGSDLPVHELAASEKDLNVLCLERNQGKGAAVLAAFDRAHAEGYTHAAVFDSDGQHEAADLPKFMGASQRHPEAMILGVPQFGIDAPSLRVNGRLVGNWWTNLETLWGGIQDSLFGFRVYPVEASISVLRAISGGRRFDFDTQLAVRLYWEGVVPLNILTPVIYKKKEAGGVSHFRYVRDNLLLTVTHACLTIRAFTLLRRLVRFKKRGHLSWL